MADYFSLITKAVNGLEKSTGEARRGLYERARGALLTQLRGVSPPLSEADITRERLALEEAIRKVEAEAARRSRSDLPPPQRPEPQRPEPPRSRPPAPPAEPIEPRAAAPVPTVSLSAAAARPLASPDASDDDHPDSGAAQPPAPPPRPERPRWTPGPSLSDQGLKGFRDVVAETETLGDATAQAARSARAALAPPGSEFERLEPRIEADLSRPLGRRPLRRDAERPAGREPEPGADRAAAPVHDAERTSRRPEPAGFDHSGQPERAVPTGPVPVDVAPRPEYPTRPPSSMMRPEELRPRAPAVPRAPAAVKPPSRPTGRWRRTAAVAILGLAVAAAAATVFWKWPSIVASFGPPGSNRAADGPVAAEGGRAKISDRIRTAAADAGTLVAQKVMFYEEDDADPAGKSYTGSVVWRTEMVSSGAGPPNELAVRAEVQIPDQKLGLRWSLRRNDDKAAASHTVEIMFTLPPEYRHGAVSSIQGVLMQQAEANRGVQLNGLAVKVMANFFLIGLSSVDADKDTNITMLKERPWFSVPLTFSDGKRAIFVVEKGTPGDRAFAEAFAAWGQ